MQARGGGTPRAVCNRANAAQVLRRCAGRRPLQSEGKHELSAAGKRSGVCDVVRKALVAAGLHG